jgi:hypothetical protein
MEIVVQLWSGERALSETTGARRREQEGPLSVDYFFPVGSLRQGEGSVCQSATSAAS